MKKILFILISITFIFSSCEKEDDSPNSNSNSNNGNNTTTPSLGLIGYGSDEFDTYKTTDGGSTWTTINGIDLHCISFP